MRTLTLLSLTVLTGSMLSPTRVLALGSTIGTLRIINECDDAVEVSADELEVQFTHILEPQASVEEIITSYGNDIDTKADITITASLVSDPSISTQRTVRVQNGKTTTVRIQTQTKKGQTSLAIAINGRSGGGNGKGRSKVAEQTRSHESDVMLASTSGLGILLLFGSLLGRAPRRPSSPADEARAEGRVCTHHAVTRSSGVALLRALPIVFCLMTLMSGLAMAGTVGRGPSIGFIKIMNTCDEAVDVNVPTSPISGPTVLEPGASASCSVFMDKSKTEAVVVAALVADPTVTATATCSVSKNKMTPATVTCSMTAGSVSLSIDCGNPQKLTSLTTSHQTDVMVASTSGLALLLVVGMFLGRRPRHDPFATNVESFAASCILSANGTSH